MPNPSDRVLVIVPAYNEADNIARVVARLRAASCDFVVINDGSTDETGGILDGLGVPHVDLIQNLGIGGAVQTGYKYALANGYGIAVQFDGDGQHDEGYIRAITAPIQAGEADLVVGSRFAGDLGDFKSSALRRFGIRVLSLVLKLSSGQRIMDVTSGFRAAGPRVVELFASDYPDDYPEPESLARVVRSGMRIAEVPVVMHERTGGTSSIGSLDSVYYMVKVGLSILLQTTVSGRRR